MKQFLSCDYFAGTHAIDFDRMHKDVLYSSVIPLTVTFCYVCFRPGPHHSAKGNAGRASAPQFHPIGIVSMK